MRLPSDHNLNGSVPVQKQPAKPVAIAQQQVGPLIFREATRKTQREDVWIKHGIGISNRLRIESPFSQLRNETLARNAHDASATFAAHRP